MKQTTTWVEPSAAQRRANVANATRTRPEPTLSRRRFRARGGRALGRGSCHFSSPPCPGTCCECPRVLRWSGLISVAAQRAATFLSPPAIPCSRSLVLLARLQRSTSSLQILAGRLLNPAGGARWPHLTPRTFLNLQLQEGACKTSSREVGRAAHTQA